MLHAISEMMNEHQLILQVLGSLETCERKFSEGEGIPTNVVLNYVRFFRGYADKFHHAKEEHILFVHMIAEGFATDSGPLAVMLREHDEGRLCVSTLEQLADAHTVLNKENAEQFATVAKDYADLLRAHIGKEDNVLYPMALRALSSEHLSTIDANCLSIDLQEKTTTAGLAAVAQELLALFPNENAAQIPQDCLTDLYPCLGQICDREGF